MMKIEASQSGQNQYQSVFNCNRSDLPKFKQKYILHRLYSLNWQFFTAIIISVFKMRTLLLGLLLVTSCFCTTMFRLSTAQTAQLNPGDTLVSTLGYFKVTLQSQNCILSFSALPIGANSTAWASAIYSPVGNLSSPLLDPTKNCQYLTMIAGQVQTDDGSVYLSVGTDFNISTILTVDDCGVLRLIGTYLLPNNIDQVSVEYNITTFQNNQTYVYAASQMAVTFLTSFPALTNQKGWTFSLPGSGSVSILRNQNSLIGVDYFYNQFILRNSKIVDFNKNSFPSVIFPNITYNPRCFQPRLYLNFKPPFVFAADPFWPILTVYDQGRYKILQISYSQLSAFYSPNKRRSLNFYNQISVCPPYTFQFLGNCTPTCPSPYFHEMRGSKGKCVLTCEEFTPTDLVARTCSCMPEYQKLKMSSTVVVPCPATGAAFGPYGCYCVAPGKFFDRTFTFSCVSTCPNKTFGSNGLCMSCPNNCEVCQIDAMFRSYFQCTKCAENYISVNGLCAQACNHYLGLSVGTNGTTSCVPCADPKCINCQANSAVCIQCNLLYTLLNGSCLFTCPNGTTQATAYFNTSCVPVADQNCSAFIPLHYNNQSHVKCDACPVGMLVFADSCVSSCPTNFTANKNGYCVCSNSSFITMFDQCLPLTACPITMTLDSLSQSCQSCPFGCLTCKDSVCTGCNPGYFLYISPQAIRCRRKSPLFPCDQQYSWVQSTCLVVNYTNSDFQMQLCVNTIPFCKVCYMGRADTCILCSPKSYLYNNICMPRCPTGMIPHDNVCVLLQIANCSIPYILSESQPTVVNYTVLAASNPYKYFTFNGLEPGNDPVGYNPYFQQLSRRKNDGYFRETSFFRPAWTCLKCMDGLGMTDNFTACVACPPPCLTCYMAKNYSCLTYSNNTAVNNSTNNSSSNNSSNNNTNNNSSKANNTVTPTGCQFYISSTTQQCVSSCDINSYPAVVNGVLYCQPITSAVVSSYAKVDSAVYTALNGSKIVYFVFEDTLKNAHTMLPVQTQAYIPSSYTFVSAAESQLTPPASSPAQRAFVASAKAFPVQDGNYIQVNDASSIGQAYIMNMTSSITSLQSSSGLYFPNTVYGVTAGLSHPDFMKTWLAVIGYIMSWVLIVVHVIFIGNDLLYKVDNVLILAQTFYFFSFVKLLVGKLLAQFYYGWIFSHGGFFPNFFINSVPSGYYESGAPLSFKLATNDANVIRNAGFSFSLLLVYLACYIVVTAFVWLVSKVWKKPDMWHPRIAINSLLGGLEFFSMNLFFWSITHILYGSAGQAIDIDFYNYSHSVAVFFIVVIVLYTIGRLIFNHMGGIYMIKRIVYASLLACAYNNNAYLGAFIIFETVFTIVRFFIERPQKNRQKWTLLVQFLIYIGCYFLLFFCLDSGVNTIALSIVVFVIIVALGSDLADLYLESQNQWLLQDENNRAASEMMLKAHPQDIEIQK